MTYEVTLRVGGRSGSLTQCTPRPPPATHEHGSSKGDLPRGLAFSLWEKKNQVCIFKAHPKHLLIQLFSPVPNLRSLWRRHRVWTGPRASCPPQADLRLGSPSLPWRWGSGPPTASSLAHSLAHTPLWSFPQWWWMSWTSRVQGSIWRWGITGQREREEGEKKSNELPNTRREEI